MKYAPIFSVTIRHGYYRDGKSPDFSLRPTAETDRLLRNFRARIISSAYGFQVVTETTATGEAFIAIPDDTALRFEMRLNSADFILITDPADLPDAPLPVYSNKNMTGENGTELELMHEKTRATEVLRVINPSSEESFVLGTATAEGASLSDFDLESDSVAGVDGYDAQTRMITLDTRNAEPGETFTLAYPVPGRKAAGIFAYIDIHANSSLPKRNNPPTQPRAYEISYRPKQARWAYYCVTNLDAAPDAYQIVDTPPAEKGEPLIFSDNNRTNLADDPDKNDRIANELAQQYPKTRRLRFLSDEPVACHQAVREHLTLRVDGDDLPGVLPNPSFRNISIGQVQVNNTAHKQDWLFEIVKVITHNGT